MVTIINGRPLKTMETRGRVMKYRGDIAIHSGMLMPVPDSNHRAPSRQLLARLDDLGLHYESLPRGYVLGVVEVYAMVPAEGVKLEAEERGELDLGNYQPHRFAYLTRNLRVLKEPVKARGEQALPWELPEHVEAKVREQLERIQTAAANPVVA